jgi:hypothetical protein
MNNIFELKKGKLVFEEDKIIIEDDAKILKRMRLFPLSIFLLLAIYNLIYFVKQNDMHLLRSALLFGLAGLILTVSTLLINAQSEIYLKDVKAMKVRRIFFKEYLVIKLANNRTRQVAGIYNAERLEEYIKTISLPK